MFNVLFCFAFFKDGTSRDEEDNSINNMRVTQRKTIIDLVIILVV